LEKQGILQPARGIPDSLQWWGVKPQQGFHVLNSKEDVKIFPDPLWRQKVIFRNLLQPQHVWEEGRV
jgi:hypothetical protein